MFLTSRDDSWLVWTAADGVQVKTFHSPGIGLQAPGGDDALSRGMINQMHRRALGTCEKGARNEAPSLLDTDFVCLAEGRGMSTGKSGGF